jgi:hypothetical protein
MRILHNVEPRRFATFRHDGQNGGIRLLNREVVGYAEGHLQRSERPLLLRHRLLR